MCNSPPFVVFFLVSILISQPALLADDWPAWRGPTSNGIAPEGPAPPLEWSQSKNILWQTPLPGRGHGSPTVVGDRIYLATADEATFVQSVIAIDRNSGKIVWQTPVYENSSLPPIHDKNTHASSTIACDGQSLFVGFYNSGQIRHVCLDVQGQIRWKKDTAKFNQRYPFGFAASPLMYRDTVIVAAESEAETALVAYRRSNGTEVWRTKRPQNSSYSSPILLTVGGREQILMLGNQEIRAYDPATGKDLWQAEGAAKHTAGTVTGEGNFVVGSGGYPQSETFCVKADGSAEVAWHNKQKCYEQSLLVHDGYVYCVNDNGVAYCWDLETGRQQWKGRLAGPVSASPVLIQDRVYISNEKGKTFVFRANPKKFELLATNQLGNEAFATPTILDGKIYARVGLAATGFGRKNGRRQILFCIGEE